MKPAYHIPLTKKELALLGEITAIQGQIEYVMLLTVDLLLGVSTPLAQRILGSTKTEINFEIWLGVIQEKCPDPKVGKLASEARPLMKAFSQGRNNFFHTVFGNMGDKQGFSLTGSHRPRPNQTAAARKIRNFMQVPMAELESVRDQGSRISRHVAEVFEGVMLS